MQKFRLSICKVILLKIKAPKTFTIILKNSIVAFLTLYLCIFRTSAQNPEKVIIPKVKGDVILKGGSKKVYNTTKVYEINPKPHTLQVDKLLDESKPIMVKFGGIFKQVIPPGKIYSGYYPFKEHLSTGAGADLFSIKLDSGVLKIRCSIFSFDGKYIAKVIDNKLVMSKEYHVYSANNFFEVFDDYYIPVLQLEIEKGTNTIYIGGAFHSPTGYTIISKTEFASKFFDTKLLMSQQKRDSLFNDYLEEAKSLIPIHE